MASIKRFEDLEAWKKARELTREIYKVMAEGEFSRDFALRNQIRCASVSIMSNIAEGFERDGDKEFRNFLSMAKGSAGEVRAQLYVAIDVQFLNEQQSKKLFQLAEDTAKLISGFMRYLTKSDLQGRKYK